MERETGLEPAIFTLASGQTSIPTSNKINALQTSDPPLAPNLAPEASKPASSLTLQALADALRKLTPDDRNKLLMMLLADSSPKGELTNG